MSMSSMPVGASMSRDPQPPLSAGRWGQVAASPAFRALLRAKWRIIAPLMVVYLGIYFTLMLLAGYGRGFMAEPVYGPLNVGYVLILGLYAMCWIISVVYVRVAERIFDPAAERAVADMGQPS